MKRLTSDNPSGNMDSVLNYVFSKDGWAYIRSDGESENVLLTAWAKRQCRARGCDLGDADLHEVDELICDCAFSDPACPVFLAYTYASQAVHLRDRLKRIEDALSGLDGEYVVPIEKLAETVNMGKLSMPDICCMCPGAVCPGVPGSLHPDASPCRLTGKDR